MTSPARNACAPICSSAAPISSLRTSPARDQALTRLRIRRDRGERLIHFMRDARGHLAHRGDAAEVRDAILHLSRFVFGASTIGDVVQRADLAQHASVGIARRLRDVMHVAQRTIGMDDAILDVHRARTGLELIARLLPAGTIRRMDHRFEIVVDADVGARRNGGRARDTGAATSSPRTCRRNARRSCRGWRSPARS